MRRLLWRFIGRRYGPKGRRLCYRSHWLAPWVPVRSLGKVIFQASVTQQMVDDYLAQQRKNPPEGQ